MKKIRTSLFSLVAFILFCLKTGAQQLVLPGDYPDPSVVKIGDTYWASATTSNWFPAYPLLKSADLVKWETAGNVFNQMPQWADYYFWAPEISYDKGKVYIYYSAHKKDGNLCVGVASADKPEGPYTDHGPLICQAVGSIDAFPMRDENGKLYLIWKEDANSVSKPTPIWIQEMNEERTALLGEKKELFRNDVPWEANLVEGVSMIRRGDYYYAFYAAAGCCGAACTYGVGVARAKSLLGPWEKYNRNPIMTQTEKWKCPGHGTPIEKDGRYYFLYHAYDAKGNIFTGRQGLLSEFTFTADNWVAFVNTSTPVAPVHQNVTDDFKGGTLSQNWQWSVFQNIRYQLKNGSLELYALPSSTGAFIGQKTLDVNYNAEVTVSNKKGAAAGIGVIGDERNAISVLKDGSTLKVVQVKNNKDSVLAIKQVRAKDKVTFRMQVLNGKDISFLYSTDGKNFSVLNEKPANGAYLPPWDRAVRVGLVAIGEPVQKATFKNFSLKSMIP